MCPHSLLTSSTSPLKTQIQPLPSRWPSFLCFYPGRQVGEDLALPGDVKVIEANGRMVMPGGIDVNTCLMKPYLGTRPVDDFCQGTKAAIAGGTTMISESCCPTANSLGFYVYKIYTKDLNVSCKEVAVEQYECGIKQSLNQSQLKRKAVFLLTVCVYGL